ncbi:MAG: hypothetical protein LUQ71_07340, partial [Methanoregula sp.]|nr:hypothetical protein [Methanoregula sp.]
MTKTTVFVTILLIVTGLTLIAGCSSTKTAPATSAAAVSVPDAGVRIITEDLPPFNYPGADGNVTGQSTEVVNA